MHARDEADLLFVGGHVWTGTARRGATDSVAVAGDRILAVGEAHDLRMFRGRRTRVIPLAGRLLLPAFQDGHVHPIMGGEASMGCDLSSTDEPAVWMRMLGEYAAARHDSDWVIGSGWTQAAFGETAPSRDLLDAVVADRPVFLASRDGHAAWANSVALRAAGLDDAAADPPNGHIVRDGAGRPTGLLMERAAGLVRAHAPAPRPEDLEEALRRGQSYLLGLGISAWHDADVDAAREAAYLALAGRGELLGRAALALAWDEERGPVQLDELSERRARIEREGAGRVRGVAVKLFGDGVIENRTAALIEPYRGERERGESRYAPDRLRAICRLLDEAGFAVHAHAIGDRAVREVLDALAAARRENGPRDARHAIAHLEMVHPADLPRFAAMGVIADCQPLWACREEPNDTLLRQRIGQTRWQRRYPFGSLARLGTTLAMGSDWDVSTADPLRIMEVAVSRTDPDHPGFRPLGAVAERLTPEIALRAYTRGSALVNHLDQVSGTIEEGKAADLVLLDGDPLAQGRPMIESRVLLTLVAGRPVFEHPTLES